MNEKIHRKNWFQRHWKWLVPALVLLLSIPVIQSSLGSALKDYSSLYLHPNIYENALVEVQKNKAAIELMGTPIETLFLVEGEVRYTNNGNSVRMTIPIKGSKSKGRMDIAAEKIKGEWVYEFIRVRTKKPESIVVVVNTE